MKKKAIFATALAAVLCMAPLAACGKSSGASIGSVKVDGKPFNMADYATELSESVTIPNGTYSEIPEFKTMQRLDMQLYSISSYYGNGVEVAREVGKDENNGKYRLYNLKNEQSIGNWYTSISTIDSSPFILLTDSDGGATTYRIAYPTGEAVTQTAFEYQSDFSTNNGIYYVDGAGNQYYSLTYSTDYSTETVYIAYKDGAWKKLTATDVNAQQTTGGYQVGDTLGIAKTPLVELNGDEEDYPDYIYKNYSYSAEGSSSAAKYTLYKDNTEKGSVTVFGGESSVLGLIGKYFYYYENQPVDTMAKDGYNFVSSSSYGTTKANMILHRFYIETGRDEVVNSNYIFVRSGSGSALYNYTTNDFDRIVVAAYKKVDGVAITSREVPAPVFTVILDENARISFDMTGKSVSSKFYQLNDNRYLSGRTILDKEMNTIAILPDYTSPVVWEEQKLILCRASNEYFAIDYDGKVTIAGMRSISGICGNSIISTDQNGETAVFSKRSPNGKTMKEIMGDQSYSTSNSSLLYVYENGMFTFYNRLGTKIDDFESVNGYLNSWISYGGKYFYTVTVQGENGYYDYVTLLFE